MQWTSSYQSRPFSTGRKKPGDKASRYKRSTDLKVLEGLNSSLTWSWSTPTLIVIRDYKASYIWSYIHLELYTFLVRCV